MVKPLCVSLQLSSVCEGCVSEVSMKFLNITHPHHQYLLILEGEPNDI